MPIYEYRCGTCGHQFEVLAKMSDPDPVACEACGAATVEKLLHPVSVHYKGSGFYSTDYGSRKRQSSGADSGSGSSGSGSGEGGGGSSGESSGSSGGDGGGGNAAGGSSASE